MNVIRHRNIFLSVSGLLVLASLIAISVWGLNFGVDFIGGSLLEIRFLDERPSPVVLQEALIPLVGGTQVQPSEDQRAIIRFRQVSEDEHQAVLNRLGEICGECEELRFDTIGPTIGAELKQKAIIALALAIVAIIFYIAWAFRQVSSPPHQKFGVGAEPVSSWKYGIVAVIALIHDAAIPTGVFAALGEFKGVEIDTLFITALLTILGFSVHDTIVVFDRIRENLRNQKAAEPFAAVVNRSIGETITRSINTSLTVLLVLGAIFFLGGATTKYFALALMLGIAFGTYSSLFVASPLLVIWDDFTKKK